MESSHSDIPNLALDGSEGRIVTGLFYELQNVGKDTIMYAYGYGDQEKDVRVRDHWLKDGYSQWYFVKRDEGFMIVCRSSGTHIFPWDHGKHYAQVKTRYNDQEC